MLDRPFPSAWAEADPDDLSSLLSDTSVTVSGAGRGELRLGTR